MSSRAAIQAARGDLCVVQDADLEYNPSDWAKMLTPFFDAGADAGALSDSGPDGGMIDPCLVPDENLLSNGGFDTDLNSYSSFNVQSTNHQTDPTWCGGYMQIVMSAGASGDSMLI